MSRSLTTVVMVIYEPRVFNAINLLIIFLYLNHLSTERKLFLDPVIPTPGLVMELVGVMGHTGGYQSS